MPKNFYAVERWPKCRQSILSIDNQMFLNSCLVIALTHSLADRFCIATDGRIQVSLSSWELITCCVPKGKLNFFDSINCLLINGTTTGGSELHVDVGCKPFALEQCADERLYANALDAELIFRTNLCLGKLPLKCMTGCHSSSTELNDRFYRKFMTRYLTNSTNFSTLIWLQSRFKSTAFKKNTNEIMHEIMQNGPVVALIRGCSIEVFNGWIQVIFWLNYII